MSQTPITTKQHIRASFRDAAFTSLNVGMAESYFCAFMLAIGINEVISGLGIVVPQFIGVLFQLLSIRSFFTQYSLKKRILLFLCCQALAMIPLILAGVLRYNDPVFIIGVLGLYWASLHSLNPAWTRLMGHTVPEKFRLKFFTIRNQFGQSSSYIGMVLSGVLLYFAKDHGIEVQVFVGIFVFGFFLKCMSIREFKLNHKDYDLAPGSEYRLPFREFIKRLKGTEQGKLVIFLFFFYITVHFSAPYFHPYMLKQLKFNYIEYMGITSLGYFGRVFMHRVLQKKARARHINTILLLATIGISTTPILWTFSQNYTWLAIIEFLSGCYWAGFELSTILLYYQKIDDRERTSVMTYINVLNTSGMVLGSILGAIFMRFTPENWDNYLALFAACTILRILLVIFGPQLDFRGQIPKLGFNLLLGIRPVYGVLTRPIVGNFKKKKKKK